MSVPVLHPDLVDVIVRDRWEHAGTGRSERIRHVRRVPGRWWVGALLLATVWCLRDAGVGRQRLISPGGAGLVRSFFAAAIHPRVDGAFLSTTARNAAVTVSYAALATLLSVIVGLLGACLLSELMWQRRLAADTTVRTPWSTVARFAVRVAFSVPRGIHEAAWGLLLINALGRDPLVAVLAIAIPFGAITAKVYAEFIDEAARGPFTVLRAAGARRTQATLFGVVPAIAHDLVSYAFYRLECSLRSAVILGMIGAGGLGFQLGLSFQGLQYGEMWTAIYAIVLLAIVSEAWAARLRSGAHQPGSSHVRTSVAAAAMVCCASWWYLGLRPWTLWSARTRMLTHRLINDMLPPRLAVRDIRPLLSAARETLQMSLLAVLIAIAVAVPLAFSGTRINTGSRTSAVSRMMARVLRSIPPTVWALLVLFVMRPGVMAGAVALGVYAAGVLARLFADALETAHSTSALRARSSRTGPTLPSAGAPRPPRPAGTSDRSPASAAP